MNGKIDKITRGTGSSKRQIQFVYDPMGNRIMKITQPQNDLGNPATGEITYYARDAQGNLMATYDLTLSGGITLGELNMYGSSRLGSRKPNLDMTTATLGDSWALYRGQKHYELTNHLGNVLTVVSDHRKPVKNPINTNIDWYAADIVMAQDYYPFGMTMPGRKYNSGAGKSRFGFNGMELDDELKGDGNSYDFGARIYDPRIGRWMSVDPLAGEFVGMSPYTGIGNNPIWYIDPDGKKIKVFGSKEFVNQFKIDLASLMQTEEGRKVVLAVVNSDMVFNVSEATAWDFSLLPFVDPPTKTDHLLESEFMPDPRGGGDMEYSQVGGFEYEGVNIQSHTTLAHEMYHAYEKVAGTLDGYADKESGINKSEIRAVGFENRMRVAFGETAIRKTYPKAQPGTGKLFQDCSCSDFDQEPKTVQKLNELPENWNEDFEEGSFIEVVE